MIKRRPLTATMLRAILTATMFAILLLGAFGFGFANSKLHDVAIDVSHTTADASASRNNLQNLQKVEKDLKDKAEVVQRANSIIADSQSYQYQNQIITDINDYAAKAGITITNITFSTTTQPTGTTTQPTTPVTPTPSGVRSMPVNVTLKNPIDYTSLLRFIKSIEQNLTKMQIAKINLSKDAGKNTVTSDTLTIQVYVR